MISNMLAVIVLALLGTALAVPRAGSRIVGGSDTSIEQYPFMINMQFSWQGTPFEQHCGGGLITEVSVLTSAHCVEGWPTSWWRACLGTSLRSVCEMPHAVSGFIIHPDFDPFVGHDLAIVRLQVPAVQSDTVKLANIAGPNYILPDGTGITAMGWGDTEHQGEPSEQLQHVVIDIINQEICAERYAFLKTQPFFEDWPDIIDGMMCAGILDVGGKDTCIGDAGGPVVHNNNVIVGIVSGGYECADSFYPGILTRISYYSDWIVQNG